VTTVDSSPTAAGAVELGTAPAVGAPVDLVRRATAEAVGTTFLLIAIVGSGIMATRLSDDTGVRLLANSVATAGGLVALILCLGPVSGAHLNPVVTLVARLDGTVTSRYAAAYIAAQVVGATAGTIIANAMFEHPVVGPSTTARSSPALWLSEIVATIGLLVVIAGCVRGGRSAAVSYAVGAWIGGAYWFTSSTSFANPAVTIGRAFTDSFTGIAPASAPMFVAMQLVGTAIAVPVIRFLSPTASQHTEHSTA